MLCLQAKDVSDPAARAAMLDVEARVRALSSLNARLDLRTAAAIDAADFLGGLAADFERTHLAGRPILLDLRAEPHPLRVAHAKPLGLIVNELLVNASKYAFPGGRGGAVGVVFECRDGDCALTVQDDGVGMDPAAPPRGTGFGRRMVRTLAAQIGGTFQIGPGADGGTRCAVRWRPAPAASGERGAPPGARAAAAHGPVA